jgi:hypothetical protein
LLKIKGLSELSLGKAAFWTARKLQRLSWFFEPVTACCLGALLNRSQRSAKHKFASAMWSFTP